MEPASSGLLAAPRVVLLERGRIVASGPSSFDLYLSLHGVETRLCQTATEVAARESYDRAMAILRPAVHDPFFGESKNVAAAGAAAGGDESLRLAIFDLNLLTGEQLPPGAGTGEPGVGGDSGASEGPGASTRRSGSSLALSSPAAGAEAPVVACARKIALKTLAAPPEAPASKRRKLISQVPPPRARALSASAVFV